MNINHAPAEVLQCLPGLTESDVSTIIAKRDAYAGNPSDTSWLTETLGQQKADAIAGLITGTSKCFSAEIDPNLRAHPINVRFFPFFRGIRGSALHFVLAMQGGHGCKLMPNNELAPWPVARVTNLCPSA